MVTRRGLPLICLLAILVGGCKLAGAEPSFSQALPQDVQRLGSLRLATADDPQPLITAETAVQAAAKSGYDYPNPETYLVVGTFNGSDSALSDVILWLVRWDGLNLNKPGPLTSPESKVTPRPYTFGYVLVDAETGSVVSVTFMD
jgi:hypothetical protein